MSPSDYRRLDYRWLGKCIILVALLQEPKAWGISSIPLGNSLDNLAAFLTADVVTPLVTTFGIVFDHRPLEPATGLGTQVGLDFGMEVDLVQIPSSYGRALAKLGGESANLTLLPALKVLNLHKGISDSVDFGGSILSYQNYLVWAVELKVVVFNPEEGATWAIRLSRNSVHVPLGNTQLAGESIDVALGAVTWTPELVVSRKLDFADPYIGVGYQYVTGSVDVSNSSGISIPGLDSIKGGGGGALGFIGLSLKPPHLGLRLTLETAFSIIGYNSLSAKLGFSF